MKHYLYKTTNLLNNRFYVGMHSSKNPNDGYLGSGRRIQAEIRKYGRENFKKEILEELPSREALKAREAQIVNDELLADPLCLNLKNGGEGGGKFWSKEHQHKATIAGNTSPNRNVKSIAAKSVETRRAKGILHKGGEKSSGFTGKRCSEQHRKILSEKNSFYQQGKGNSQYGTCWVTDGVKPIKIKKEQLAEYLSNGYSRGRVGEWLKPPDCKSGV